MKITIFIISPAVSQTSLLSSFSQMDTPGNRIKCLLGEGLLVLDSKFTVLG